MRYPQTNRLYACEQIARRKIDRTSLISFVLYLHDPSLNEQCQVRVQKRRMVQAHVVGDEQQAAVAEDVGRRGNEDHHAQEQHCGEREKSS